MIFKGGGGVGGTLKIVELFLKTVTGPVFNTQVKKRYNSIPPTIPHSYLKPIS